MEDNRNLNENNRIFFNRIKEFFQRNNQENNQQNREVVGINVLSQEIFTTRENTHYNDATIPFAYDYDLIDSDLVPSYIHKDDKIQVVQIENRIPYNIGLEKSEINSVIFRDVNPDGQQNLELMEDLFKKTKLSNVDIKNDYIATPKPVAIKRIREYSPGRTHSREVFEGPQDLVIGYVRVVNENIVLNWDDDKEEKVLNALIMNGDILSCGKGLLSLCCNAIRYWENQIKFLVQQRLLVLMTNINKNKIKVYTHGYCEKFTDQVVFPYTVFSNDIDFDIDNKEPYKCNISRIPKSTVFLNVFDKIKYILPFDNIGFTIFIPQYMFSKDDTYFHGYHLDTENGYITDGDFSVPYITETKDLVTLSSIEFNGMYLVLYKIQPNNIGIIYEQSSIIKNYYLNNEYKITENFIDNVLTIHYNGISYEESLIEIHKLAVIIPPKIMNNYSQFCARLGMLNNKNYIHFSTPIRLIQLPLFQIIKEILNDMDLSYLWSEERKIDFGTCTSDYTLNKTAVELDMKHFYDIRDPVMRMNIYKIAKNFSYILKLTGKNKLGIDELFKLLESDFNKIIPNCNLQEFKEQMLSHLSNYDKIYNNSQNKMDRRFFYRRTNVFINRFEDISVLKKFAAYMNMFRVSYKSVLGTSVISPYTVLKLPKVLFNLYKVIYLSYLKVEDIPCTCAMHKTKYVNIIPTSYEQDENILYYNSCLRTVFSSIKRHCMFVVQPDYYEVLKFKDYVLNEFAKMKPYLKKINYSYERWFDHLNAKKQMDIIKCQNEINKGARYPNKVKHSMFTKIEKQSKNEKTRTIMGVNVIIKNVTGPIDWMIENDFSQANGFYSGKKNVDDYNVTLNELNDQGFVDAFEGDGSAFDITQHVFLKFIDEMIYDYYLEDIDVIDYHKDILIDGFSYDISFKLIKPYIKKILLQPVKVLEARKNFIKDFIFVDVVGTVFSGSTSTTCMNTIRNYFLNRYTTRFCLNIRYFTKGDDFMAFYKGTTFSIIKNCYDKLWSDKSDMFSKKNKGLGVIMKKLIKRTIKTIHFCSNFIVTDGCKFIFVRELNRLFKFGAYSRKAALYSPGQLKQYLYDLAVALKACNLSDKPFYRIFYQQYMKYADKINAEPESINKGRIRVHLSQDYNDELDEYNIDNDEYRDYYYSRIFHDTKLEIDIASFYDSVFNNYGLTENDELLLQDFFDNSDLNTILNIPSLKIVELIKN